MTNPVRAYAHEVERRPHECNVYCHDDVHCGVLYALAPLMADDVALIASGDRYDIVDWREAPEVPPIDPTAPEVGEFPYRYYVWSRSIGWTADIGKQG